MKAIDVANVLISCFDDGAKPTNLKLNKLVYYSQVESLRQRGTILFDDKIEAWQYGPVIPAVYRAFKGFGRSPVALDIMESPVMSTEEMAVISYVSRAYGKMTPYDLVSMTHREGGAWSRVYSPCYDNEITVSDIRESTDMEGISPSMKLLGAGIDGVMRSVPNALKMLEDS